MTSADALYNRPRVAAGYAYGRPAVHPRILEHVRQYLHQEQPAKRALDIGCGAGRSTAALETLASEVTGIDPAPAMMQHRRDVAPRAHFVVGRAEGLPFAAGSFALVTAAGSINYTDVELALPEIARVLTPYGTFVIYDFSAGRRFLDSPALGEWYADFDRRYPDPPGYGLDVSRLPFDRAGLVLDRYQNLEVPIVMTPDAYLRYAMSETRIELAIAAGAPELDVRAWCAETLTKVFGGASRTVVFDAYFACVRR